MIKTKEEENVKVNKTNRGITLIALVITILFSYDYGKNIVITISSS